jgi:hypothetical protein
MKTKRFELIHFIEREDFYFWKNQNNFNQRIFIMRTKIHLWEKCSLEVQYFKNKSFISKWLHNYYEKKDLIENYTYLDIDIKFYENFNLARILTKVIIESYKTERK